MALTQQTAFLNHRLATLRPDFLIISPAKTGSTWLAANLRCHPQIFVPAVKEVKYFSSFYQWFDLDWYLDHFRPASGRLKGEASPSYAILPLERIRLLHQLLPDVKLIYLMREPIARSWSHARHNEKYREANFASCPAAAGPVTEEQWLSNFTHDWPLNSGDYLGQLRRWLSVFPSEQMYVGFFESIVSDPATLLRQLFGFLGVDPEVNLSSFPLFERILPGTGEKLTPSRARFLHRLWHDRTVELAALLDTHFDLKHPAEWQAILTPDHDHGSDAERPLPGPVSFHHECADRYLSSVVDQEQTFPSAYRPVLGNYFGYQLFFYRGELFALALSLGGSAPPANPTERQRLQDQGDCFSASSVAELKDRVAQHSFEQTQGKIQTLETELRDARSRIAVLEETVAECRAALRRMEEKALGLSSPREFVLLETFRAFGRRTLRAWRRLAAFLV